MAKRLSLKQRQLIKRHSYILEKLTQTNDKDRRTILRNAPRDLFKAIDLIYRLLVKNQLDLSNAQKSKLKQHSRIIKSTSRLGASVLKKKLPRQTGGSLKSILSTILPVLGTIIRAVL